MDFSCCIVMVHLYLCLPDRCRQKIHKSKGDRQCKIGQEENVCLFCSYVFPVRTGQVDRGINAPLTVKIQLPIAITNFFDSQLPHTKYSKEFNGFLQ